MSKLSRSLTSRSESWTDERLVTECLNGNEDAWIGLIHKYKGLIYSIPIKYGMSADDASEIFQQVCAMLVEELQQLREPKSMAAWLIKITAHKCFRFSRQARHYQPIEDDGPGEQIAVSEEPADVLLFELEREQLLREALLAIDPRCQELIHMLFFESPARPYDEVAHSLHLARGSIGFIRMRCLKRLRVALEKKRFR